MAIADRIVGTTKDFRRQRLLVGEVLGDLSDGSVKATGEATFSTLADWMAALILRVLVETTAPDENTNLFTENGTTTRKGKIVWRAENPGSHADVSYSGFHIEARPIGSGKNGPSSADFGQTISAIKQDWTTNSPPAGEVDGLYIVVRQSGPDADSGVEKSDAAGILVDAQSRGDVGFVTAWEASSSNIDRSNAVNKSIQTQIGALDIMPAGNGGEESYGFMASSTGGANTYGVFVQENGGTWDYFIRCMEQGGTTRFQLSKTQALFRTALVFAPGASVTPAQNGDVAIEFTNNTTLTFRAKGNDGTVRSGTLTLS